MNNPFIWNWLRLLAGLYVLCLALAGVDVSLSFFLSPKTHFSLSGILHLGTLWWILAFCSSFLFLPLQFFLWARVKTEDGEDGSKKQKQLPLARWREATQKFTNLTLGPSANHHWGFGVAIVTGFSVGYLAQPLIKSYVQNVLMLSTSLSAAFVVSLAWGVGYLTYRTISKLFRKSATFPSLIVLATMICLWHITGTLASIDLAYAIYSPSCFCILLVVGAAILSKFLTLRRATFILTTSLILTFVSAMTHTVESRGQQTVMHGSRWGVLLPKYTLLFFDVDADNTPSLFPQADCGSVDEFQNFEAIEIIGDGIDNNCLGGDIKREEIAPMSAPDAPLQPITRAQGSTKLPPIIFISVDTLRADHIGKKIKDRSITPKLDKFFNEATYFTHTYAPSTHTMDSMPSTFSGMFPGYTLLNGTFLGNDRTFPEMVNELGYTTEGIISLPEPHHSLMVGFDRIDNELGSFGRASTTGPTLTTYAQRRLKKLSAQKNPFLLWLHYFEPHGFYIYVPNMTPWMDHIADGIQKSYAQEIWRADAFIGIIFKELKELGIYDDSIIVFFSDHGEGMGEDGIYDHAFKVAEGILRVPFAIKLPGKAPQRVDTPVSLLDLVPTLIEYLKLEGTDPRPGRSLMPAIDGMTLEPKPVYLSSTYNFRPLHWVVIDVPWKLVFDRQRFTFQLQNIEDDPNALGDVKEEHPEIYQRLFNLLVSWRDRYFHNLFIEQKANRLKARGPFVPKRLRGRINFPHDLPTGHAAPRPQSSATTESTNPKTASP